MNEDEYYGDLKYDTASWNDGYQQGRRDAVDKFLYMCRQSMVVPIDGDFSYVCDMRDIERIAKQIEEKKNE